MTPLCDIMSVRPAVGKGPNPLHWHRAKLAMAVSGKNRHYLMKDVQRRHFNAMAALCSCGPTAEALIEDLLDRTLDVIEKVIACLPPAFPARVADGILQGLADSAKRLDAMPAN